LVYIFDTCGEDAGYGYGGGYARARDGDAGGGGGYGGYGGGDVLRDCGDGPVDGAFELLPLREVRLVGLHV